MSNVFRRRAEERGLGAAATIAADFPSLPLVGYEHGDSLAAAVAGGFTEIGALRIWLRPEVA